MIRIAVAIGLLFAWIGGAAAHDLRSAYLAITETAPASYTVYWKVPALGDLKLALQPRLPDGVVETQRTRAVLSDSYVERWQFHLPGGMAGKTVSIDGLASIGGDALVRVQRLDGSTQVVHLTPAAPSFPVAAAQKKTGVAWTYFTLGIEHILMGVDHLLFVLGLMLLVAGWKRLALTITAFTLAHSITLAAATFGIIRMPAGLVETLIALSILFLAVEVARSWKGERGFTSSYPWLVAFAFGLLHGLGFASGLTALGLPQSDIPLALFSFNIGVEAGQLGFVAVIFALRWAATVIRFRWNGAVAVLACYLVGVAGAYWSIARLVPLLAELA